MWSILKESLGKDLTHITLPFFFNEPLSVLQKTMEDLEYATLLNKVNVLLSCLSMSFVQIACMHAFMCSCIMHHALMFVLIFFARYKRYIRYLQASMHCPFECMPEFVLDAFGMAETVSLWA